MGGPLAFPATAIRSVPSGRIVGRSTTGTGRAELLTAEQLRELCSLYSVSQIDSALAGKVGTSDSRLSDARTPTAHTHSQSDVTGLSAALSSKVDTSDSRLSDARTPTSHTHSQDDITGLAAALASIDTASALDQTFSGTITWTGTTAPSGTATTRYSWVRVGKMVYFCFRFQWTTAGAVLTAAQWARPADMPLPAVETGTGSSEIIAFFSGGAVSSLTIAGNGAITESRIQYEADDTVTFRTRFPSTNLMTLIQTGVYRCE